MGVYAMAIVVTLALSPVVRGCVLAGETSLTTCVTALAAQVAAAGDPNSAEFLSALCSGWQQCLDSNNCTEGDVDPALKASYTVCLVDEATEATGDGGGGGGGGGGGDNGSDNNGGNNNGDNNGGNNGGNNGDNNGGNNGDNNGDNNGNGSDGISKMAVVPWLGMMAMLYRAIV